MQVTVEEKHIEAVSTELKVVEDANKPMSVTTGPKNSCGGKATVVGGGGWQGSAIAYALAKLGFEVRIADSNAKALGETEKKITDLLSGVKIEKYLIHSGTDYRNVVSGDIVISAAPYRVNPSIAQACQEKELRYCDLGGDPATSQSIHAMATNLVFTDLGLAPGLGNILAEEGYRALVNAGCKQFDSVEISVGGLPAKHSGNFKYSMVFNVHGVYNEYTGPVDILVDNEIKTRTALSVSKIIRPAAWGDYYAGDLERSITKGGIGNTLRLMQDRGFRRCSYGTLRFPGHFDVVRSMLNEMKMNESEFVEYFQRACPPTKEDVVIVCVDVNNEHHNGWTKSFIVKHDENWTAMQKSTGFTVAAIACIMANGVLDDCCNVLGYEDVPFDLMKQYIQQIDKDFGDQI